MTIDHIRPGTSRRASVCRIRSVCAVAAALALLATQATPAVALPSAKEVWIRVDTANFTLYSNVSRQHTVKVGRRLELFRDVLARLNPDLEVNSPLPTYVFVFRERSFAPYRVRFGTGPTRQDAYFAADRDANYVALNATPKGDWFAPVYHEFVHYFLNNNFSNVPLWFNEGLAEYYSTFRFSDTNEAEIGRPVEEYADWLRDHRMIFLTDLFTITTRSREYNEEDRQGVFYAQSWALVHYLIWGDPDWKSDLANRVKRLDAGESLIGLVHVPTYKELAEDLRAYVMRRRYLYAQVEFKSLDVDTDAKVVPIDRAEALYRLGDLLARIESGKEKEAEKHFREAIRVDPSHAASYAGLGFLRDREGRHEEASGHYERAFSLDPDNYLTCFLYATNLGRLALGNEDEATPIRDETPPRLLRARELYKKSILLRPNVAEAYAGLGATYIVEAGDLSDGIDALETARRMLPSRMEIVFHLMQLYARSDRRERAQSLMDDVLSRSASPKMVGFGREMLLRADLMKADLLFQESQYDEGLEILLQVQAATQDADLNADLESRIRELRSGLDERRRVEETNQQIALYNKAVARANDRDYAGAIAILKRVIRDAQDAGLVREARDLLRQLEEATRQSRRPSK